ncbi:flagellar filament capping protein FliD [Enterobacteriaceae bacterium C23F]
MASFSVPGIGGSGLDIPSMLAQLRTAENQKLNPYLQKQTSYNGQISSWGKISSALDSMKSNLEKLQNEGFNGVSVGDNKAFKVTAGKGAIPNSYSVYVEQMAKSHKIASVPQDKNDELLGDKNVAKRTLSITVGDEKPMEIELAHDQTSLTQIAKKINEQNGDVTASVMPAEGGKFKLVTTSKKTGSEGELKIEVKGDPKLADVLDYDTAKPNVYDPKDPSKYDPDKALETAPAQDAILYIDGEKVESSSNTVTDAITGLTLELRSVSEKDDKGEFKAETLAVTADTSKVKSLIEEFVNQYNNFLSTAASASAYKEPEEPKDGELAQPNPDNGALFGDGTLRRLTSQLKSVGNGNYAESSEMYQSLASLGITVKFDTSGESTTMGKLSIDSKKLDEALKSNPKEVENLFLGKGGTKGLKGEMEGLFNTYLGDSDSVAKNEGAITTTINGLKDQEKRVAKQITTVEKRIEDSLKRSEKEFLRLDQAMSEMNNMSQQLQSALLGALK